MDAARVVGVELAAGAGTRFGGGKLTAQLEGRPLAAHAATAALACGIPHLVIVLGADADAVEAALVADGMLPGLDAGASVAVHAVRNDRWATGLASSVRCGLEAAAVAAPDAEAALLLLGDQPRVSAGTIARLLGTGVDAARPFAVARRRDGEVRNPVLVHRSAWSLADGLPGDRGFGPFVAARPELVGTIEEVEENPDVDTVDDLAALTAGSEQGGAVEASSVRRLRRAEAVWVARVRANDVQSRRVRETPEPDDFYGPVAGVFVVDPRREDDAVLDVLLGLARPDDRWLDIGAGAGRFALPLALRVREVVAIDPSPSMLDGLREGMARHGIENVAPVTGRWPLADPAAARDLGADVALIAHVGYDIEAIGPFLDAMEDAASRLCVAVMSERVPSWPAGPFWPPVHGETRIELPALAPFVDLLRERGASPRVTSLLHPPRSYRSRDELLGWIRHQLFIAEGSEKDRRAVACLDAWTVETPDGFMLAHQVPIAHGVVAWEPVRR